MTRAGNASKRGLNRGLRYIRHHSILRKVSIVAERMGIRIIEVNPKCTSQECCVCSYTSKENRKGERFLCLACGRIDNADGNASVNMVQRGTDVKVPAGGGITLERREMGRARKPPRLAHAAPDAMRRREKQACNRPKTSSAMKHLGRYAYVTRMLRVPTQRYNSRSSYILRRTWSLRSGYGHGAMVRACPRMNLHGGSSCKSRISGQTHSAHGSDGAVGTIKSYDKSYDKPCDKRQTGFGLNRYLQEYAGIMQHIRTRRQP